MQVVRCPRILLACVLLAAGLMQASAATPAYPARISQRDRSVLAAKACTAGSSGAERIEGTARSRNSTATTARVQCAPHATFETLPLVHYTDCSNAAGTWRCEAGHDAIHMKLPNAAVLPVVAQDVPPHMALVAIREASKLLVPPFHKPAIELMQGSCTVSPHGSTPSREMKLFDIRCGRASMLLTQHCWSGGCRYFIPQGEGY
ncbi:MAG: hypothetical protein WDO12_08800 [Pseudomonadota bacterium]